MSKQYKIAYKVYPNKRLKEVSFHGKATHPIYIQITYKRRNAIFKSYYFNLLSRPRYGSNAKDKRPVPTVQDIIKMDSRVIDHLIENASGKATLESLIKDYYFYSKDLCEATEEAFHVYMFVFLVSNGLSTLGRVLANSNQKEVLYDLLKDLNKSLKPEYYEKLVNESLKSGQPYLQLYGFALKNHKPPYLYLSIMEWKEANTQAAFASYMEKNYADHPADLVIAQINKLIAVYRNL